MNGHVYRGTSLAMATEQEFANGRIEGRDITLIDGFMDPDDIERDYHAEGVRDLPWEVGPDFDTTSVVGGISERLGAADSFADGGLPVVMHLDRSRLSSLTAIRYRYDDYDAMPGTLAWVDGTAGGELRINGDLVGLVNPEMDGEHTIRYYGENLRSRAAQYSEEMEQVHIGDDVLNVAGALRAAVTYIRRPIAHLTTLDGYVRAESHLTDDADTVVGDWSDEEAFRTLAEELRRRAPSDVPVYAVHVERHLAQETWGYNESDVVAVYTGDGERQSAAATPDHVFGD